MKKFIDKIILIFKKAGSYSSKPALALCLLLALYIVFYNLGKAPFDNWDEAWYAEVTKQILRTKEFIVLNWNHQTWLDKPPLYMWVSAFFSSIFGLSEFSIRLTSALSGLSIISMVLIYSYRNYGILPSLLAFSSIALNNVFIWRTRSGNIDVFVTLLIFISYFLMINKNRHKYILLGLIFALIYLTKASLVLFPLSIFILHEVLFERKNILKNYPSYLKLALVLCILPGIWLLLGYLKVGPDFINYYLFKSDQGVSSIDLTRYNSSYVNYMYYSLQRRFFWVLLIGAAFALLKIKNSKHFLLLLFAFLLLFQLSFTTRSNNWYLIPAMPFWSILIAYGTYNVINKFRKNLIVVLAIIFLSAYVSYRTFTINILPTLDSSSTANQTQSGKELNNLTDSEDIVVRLDHLYPATIYYSDRRVLSSPKSDTDTRGFWISKKDLTYGIRQGKIKWLVGKNEDAEQFKNSAPDLELKLRRVNDEETIIEVL